MSKPTHDVRAQAALILARVLSGASLSRLLESAGNAVKPRDRNLLHELCYGVLRWYYRLDCLAARKLRKPFKARDNDIHGLLLLGIYQLSYMRIPPHAAVAETVGAARILGKPWAAKLLNAVLRGYQREGDAMLAQLASHPAAAAAHPEWLYERLRKDWPEDWPAILEANNARAPMSLRVNRARLTRDAYLEQLAAQGIEADPIIGAEDGVQLRAAMDVNDLPGFAEGRVSVQDGAAQLAAPLLDARDGERVLDACAAPGGKTAHILEALAASGQSASVHALDVDGERLEWVAGNLTRLQLAAGLLEGDAAKVETWWDGLAYDRILLDAPCSATGVIRRHPDIKVLRRASDVGALAARQQEILRALWPLLKPGGRLLYATCSVLKAENAEVLEAFTRDHEDALVSPLDVEWGRPSGAGRQILPGENGMDGFYYACLEKRV